MTVAVKKEGGYAVVVDYEKRLPKMIEGAGVFWANPEITEEYFPVRVGGKEKVIVYLLKFDQCPTTEEALQKVRENGFRPATLPELLALGAAYPELWKQFPLLALVFPRCDSSYMAPGLYLRNEKCALSLGLLGADWGEDCRFVVVKAA